MNSRKPPLPGPGIAKQYNRIKLITGVTSSVVSFVVLVMLVLPGYARGLEAWVYSFVSHPYVALLAFSVAVGLLQTAATIPLSFYSGYVIEHRFGLSNQSLWRWLGERAKGLFLSVPLAAIVLIALYYCLRTYGDAWWLPVGIMLTLLTVGLARLAPVLIMPLFYRFTPLPDGPLKERITCLCKVAGVKIEGIFSFDLSKNTRKANAGFTGIGGARRIILGDTLVREFAEEEIETVFAHELGHYRHHHILIGIGVSIASTFAGLYAASLLYSWSVRGLGFGGIDTLAALPLLAIWLSVFGLVTAPLGNMLSRHHERQADTYAVRATRNRNAFISALRKLASINLADPAPHPLVEFFFHSHPSIERRIRMLESITVP